MMNDQRPSRITLIVALALIWLGMAVVIIRGVQQSRVAVFLTERFDDPDNATFEITHANVTLENERLHVLVFENDIPIVTYFGDRYRDFSMQVTTWPVGDIADAYIVLRFRDSRPGWYEVWLRPNQNQVQAWKYVFDDRRHITSQSMTSGWVGVPDNALQPDINHIRLDAQDNAFNVWANDTPILTFLDVTGDTFWNGRVGVGAGGASQGEATFAIDDVVVTPP